MYLGPFLRYLALNNGMILKFGFGVVQGGHWNWYHSNALVQFPSIVWLYPLSCIISEIKEDIGRKSRFLMPLAFDALLRGVPVWLLPYTVWCVKTRMMWLPDGVKVWGLCNRFDRIPACDGQTDGQISCDGIVRAVLSIAQKKILIAMCNS